jgi:hypothetical protein
MFFLPLSLGQPGVDPQVLLPSTEKLKTPGRSAKGRPREYTHTHMGIHVDIEGKRKKRSVTRQTSWVVSPSIKRDVLLILIKNQKWVTKILTGNGKCHLERLEMKEWVL